MCALGAGLTRAGHAVRVATHAQFRSVVQGYGLAYAPMALDPPALLHGTAGRSWGAAYNNPLRFMGGLVRAARPAIPQLARDAWTACAQADAVVYNPLGMVGHHVGEKLGVPTFLAALQPIMPTRHFPSVLAPVNLRLGGRYNHVSHLATEQAFWQPWRREFNRVRRDLLDLPPLPLSGIGPQLRRQRTPHLYGFSRAVVPPPADWPTWAHVTGYWFPAARKIWRVPPQLEEFLAAGAAPVCVGFSSLRPAEPRRLTQTVVAALRGAGRRGVLLVGWGALELQPGLHGSDIYVAGAVPHEYLFERAAAVVHPGGAGTSAAALRAGVPSVVVPGFSDQFFWAHRLQQIGVAPPPLKWRELTPQRLASAIDTAVSSEAIRDAVRAAGARVRSEDGVGAAVATIERYLGVNSSQA